MPWRRPWPPARRPLAEHGHERQLPVRVEAAGEALQAAREVGVAGHLHAPDRRSVVAAQEWQLREQAGEGGAQAQVRRIATRRTNLQPFARHGQAQGQRRRFELQVDAAPVERHQCIAGVGIQRQRAVERRLQRAPGGPAPVRSIRVGVGGGHRRILAGRSRASLGRPGR
jgi:hypothetical protein